MWVPDAGVGHDLAGDVLLELALLYYKVAGAVSEEVNITWIISVLYEEVWHRHSVNLLNVDVQYFPLSTFLPAIVKAPHNSLDLHLTQNIAEHTLKQRWLFSNQREFLAIDKIGVTGFPVEHLLSLFFSSGHLIHKR